MTFSELFDNLYSERKKKKKRKEVSSMTTHRENLINRMIRLYGYEHPAVIEFCKLCENTNFPDNLLEVIVNTHENG